MKPTHVKRRYLFKALGLLIVFMQSAISFAQSIVNGTIRNRDEQPISGATVKVVGTSVTTRTDQKGSFTVQVDQLPAELQVSYIGYLSQSRKITVAGTQSFVLQSDERQIDEVVVVAYGTQKKNNVVGSVVQIGGDQLKKAPSMNLTNALVGRVPGLTALQQSGRPGADNATLYLRGVGTYGGNRSPLVIVDDIERPLSTLAYLDPSEIETISFLKDAVSTAAYGVQAANGIILVKTKNGRKEQTKVTYDFGYSIGQNTRFPKFLNGPDYMNWYNKGTELDNDFLRNTKQTESPYIYTQELIDAVANGTNTNPLFGNTDWIGLLADNNSYSQHHAATISGGASKTQYFASVSHMNQDGVIDNTNFKRPVFHPITRPI